MFYPRSRFHSPFLLDQMPVSQFLFRCVIEMWEAQLTKLIKIHSRKQKIESKKHKSLNFDISIQLEIDNTPKNL